MTAASSRVVRLSSIRLALLLVALVVASGANPLVLGAAAPVRAGDAVAFVNVNLVSMDPEDRTVQKRMTVVVEDGVITAVGSRRDVEVPAGAVVVNGKGKYLLPGLNDMHFHIRQIRGLPEDFEPEDVYTILLGHGITGFLDSWGFPQAFRWQRDLERGTVLGPRFHFTSPGIDEDDYAGPAAIANDVRKFARKGYRWIKTHNLHTEDAFDALFDAAAKAGVPVVGHAMRPGFSIGATLQRMPRMIAPVEEILSTTAHDQTDYEAQFAAAVQAVADSRTWVTTTLITYRMIADTVDDDRFTALPTSPGMQWLPPTVALLWTTQNPYRDPGFLQDRAYWLQELRIKQHIVGALDDAGHADRLLTGTDAGGPPFVIPGVSLHEELQLLQKAGLSAMEAIRAATYNPALFFEEAEVAGTVSVGKRADLILVKKNPTKKVRNLEKLAGTMVRGVWLPEETLRQRLDELAERWERRF